MPVPVTPGSYRRQVKGNRTFRKLSLRLLALLMLIAAFMFVRFPGTAKGYLYIMFREVVKLSIMVKTSGWETLESDNILVRYRPGEEQNAKLVLETAEHFQEQVMDEYHLKLNKKLPVILYSTREELNASFGWPANESAMGVYWGGTIRVLSPEEWITYDNYQEKETVFQSSGPVVHEIMHLVIDYRTKGNYPRWFTEGLAQYEEYRLTGFRFNDPAGDLRQKLYPLERMDRDFDSLPNQSLAYRQSLSAVEYIIEVYGKEKLHTIINDLSRGRSFSDSLQRNLGSGLKEFERDWHDWLFQNITEQ
jgi:hypothetical protein